MTPETTATQPSQDPGFTDATDLVDTLLADPALAPDVTAVRDEMREADKAYLMTLAMVRKAADFTQNDIANRLNISQAAVAQMEKRGDMLWSSLRSYLEATGARASIRVNLPDGTVAEISLEEASRPG